MSLLQMSFSGAVMIIVILFVRMAAINKLPKIVFVVLWEIAFLRLLIPISIPSVFSAYSMIRENHITQEVFTEGPVSYLIPEAQEVQFAVLALIPETQEAQSAVPALIPETQEAQSAISANVIEAAQHEISATPAEATFPLWMVLWIAGMILCALFFLITYLRCYREFRMSLPVSNAFAERWLKEHQIKRGIRIRQSDRISSPLTYGIFRPVILMPKTTDWEDIQRLQYVLQHEYVHIRRFDMIRKLVAALVLCIHWFNPTVWIMYLIYNRDIELSCDESVVRKFGESSKQLYAKALIAMEEKRNSLQPLSNSFSKNAIEERIKAVMKTKKVTVWAAIISVAVIIIIILVFATSANKAERDEQENTNIAGYDEQENMNTDGEDTINNYEGEWHRTGVGSYQWAEFTISDWKEGESFEVSGDASYGYYGGPIEGTAIFIEDDLAVLYDENVEDFLQNREGDHGIYFQFLEDSIIVTHDSYVRLWFGGGGIATAEGTYIQGEPEYTNCDDVSEIFSDGELNQIQELLGESYNNLFKNIIETGEMTEYEIDNGRLWEAYRPPYGAEWCNIIIYDDGRIYIEGQAYTGPTQFYTNSEDTEMPNIEMLKSEQERSHNYWYTEPDPQDTFMLRVEGNISANQAWVDFLKGEMPDYTGVDFSSGRYGGLGRPYTLQDMEGYSLDLWAYGQTEYVEDGGILTDIQIFPYDVDADKEEELLFVCKSYAGLVKLWVLDEAYEDTWLLYPSVSNWTPPGHQGRAWLWSDGFICKQDDDIYIKNCPDSIYIFRIGERLGFYLECNQYRSSDTLVQYELGYEEEDGRSTAKVMFDRNGVVTDGSLIYAENVCTGPAYDDDLAIITQIYEERVGDAVPVRELTGLDGTEDGIITVTREEFYSGAYLK